MNKIEDLRQRAIDDFFSTIDQMDIQLDSASAREVAHETADAYVPGHYSDLLELASEPYGRCSGNFFLLSSVSTGLLGSETTPVNVLQRAVYEFLLDEIRSALSDKIDEQGIDTGEEEN